MIYLIKVDTTELYLMQIDNDLNVVLGSDPTAAITFQDRAVARDVLFLLNTHRPEFYFEVKEIQYEELL